jgi:hypothetical protein
LTSLVGRRRQELTSAAFRVHKTHRGKEAQDASS